MQIAGGSFTPNDVKEDKFTVNDTSHPTGGREARVPVQEKGNAPIDVGTCSFLKQAHVLRTHMNVT